MNTMKNNNKKPVEVAKNAVDDRMKRPAGCLQHRAGPNRNGSSEDHVMAKRLLPSPDVLRQLFEYDPQAGSILYKERPVVFFASTERRSALETCRLWNARFAGKPAFVTHDSGGYLCGRVLWVKISAHRAAWAIHYGKWPDQNIDHIDGDPKNNRIANLRDVSAQDNGRNRQCSPKGSGLPRGVYLDAKKRLKFRAQVGVDGKMIHIGRFATPEEAHAAYLVAARKLGFTDRHIRPLGHRQRERAGR